MLFIFNKSGGEDKTNVLTIEKQVWHTGTEGGLNVLMSSHIWGGIWNLIIASHVNLARVAFNNKKKLFTSNSINMELRKVLVMTHA